MKVIFNFEYMAFNMIELKEISYKNLKRKVHLSGIELTGLNN